MARNKKISAIIAAVVCVAMLLTGTFAWQQMIAKTNEFIGQRDGGILHDDFDPDTGAKDVYVENVSDTPIFVRVRLDEAMNLNSNTWRPQDSDKKTHIPNPDFDDCELGNGSALFHQYFTWEMGGQKWYIPADGNDKIVGDPTEYKAGDVVNGVSAKQTPYATLISMASYNAMGEPAKSNFTGWVYDRDGYAYWSQPLGKGEITGLLIHRVNTSSALDDTDYYYAIDVNVEAVDSKDLPMWTVASGNNDGKGKPSIDQSGTQYKEATAAGKNAISYISGLKKWNRNLTGTAADVGKTFSADGHGWTVRAADGSGNILIVANEVAQTKSTFTDLKTKLTQYGNGLVDLKNAVRNADVTGEMSAVASKGVKCFALSITEATTYFGNDAARALGTWYWLRNAEDANRGASVGVSGKVNSHLNEEEGAIRLAMWVKP